MGGKRARLYAWHTISGVSFDWERKHDTRFTGVWLKSWTRVTLSERRARGQGAPAVLQPSCTLQSARDFHKSGCSSYNGYNQYFYLYHWTHWRPFGKSRLLSAAPASALWSSEVQLCLSSPQFLLFWFTPIALTVMFFCCSTQMFPEKMQCKSTVNYLPVTKQLADTVRSRLMNILWP